MKKYLLLSVLFVSHLMGTGETKDSNFIDHLKNNIKDLQEAKEFYRKGGGGKRYLEEKYKRLTSHNDFSEKIVESEECIEECKQITQQESDEEVYKLCKDLKDLHEKVGSKNRSFEKAEKEDIIKMYFAYLKQVEIFCRNPRTYNRLISRFFGFYNSDEEIQKYRKSANKKIARAEKYVEECKPIIQSEKSKPYILRSYSCKLCDSLTYKHLCAIAAQKRFKDSYEFKQEQAK